MEQKDQKTLRFPDNFIWGSSTSAYQIEGGLVNNWSEWEKGEKRIKALKKQDKNPDDFISGKACNSYELFDEDLKCIKELNLKAYRFSIDWSRVEPEKGVFSEEGINYYKSVVKKLKENGVEPFVTIWHWPVPLWLKEEGGWEAKNIVEYFAVLTKKIVTELEGVAYWITLNEPNIYTLNSYLTGKWPPQKKNPLSVFRVYHNLIKAHKKAYSAIKKINPFAQVGIAAHNNFFEAYKNRLANNIFKGLADWAWNFYFLNKIKDHQDFIGLNHYFHNRINYGFNKNDNELVSDMGWELYPEAIFQCLEDLRKYNKPVYITENGLADREDKYRSWFIRESLKNVHKAIQVGVDVRGYFYWSMLDNFEWAAGYDPKFGLYSVDRKTFKRTPRPSAIMYSEICKNNEVITE